ncbi:helix-turn-helix transcriptional regulator [Paraflavitalea speifideaquila]|uniref:helix-turn-helix transcriptional regulator n=1 Tax=Paraflavitalea speifideaquila TaxID=3076558 RepID=UPI0028E4A6CF|nr:helix-turn-helix domain-containing protein [Paraflavitalea speifideiaquila]
MNTTAMASKAVHHGNNVKRLRETLHVKQEALADAMGVSQQKISLLEQKEQIDRAQMEEIAKALKIPAELIEHYDAEATISIIANHFAENPTLNDSATLNSVINGNYTFNPLDEMLKAIEDYKRAHEENKQLYEQLLKAEREKVALLEKMVVGK